MVTTDLENENLKESVINNIYCRAKTTRTATNTDVPPPPLLLCKTSSNVLSAPCVPCYSITQEI